MSIAVDIYSESVKYMLKNKRKLPSAPSAAPGRGTNDEIISTNELEQSTLKRDKSSAPRAMQIKYGMEKYAIS